MLMLVLVLRDRHWNRNRCRIGRLGSASWFPVAVGRVSGGCRCGGRARMGGGRRRVSVTGTTDGAAVKVGVVVVRGVRGMGMR